jgi:cobalt-zinc-cadmium efflux system outer membrane protein
MSQSRSLVILFAALPLAVGGWLPSSPAVEMPLSMPAERCLGDGVRAEEGLTLDAAINRLLVSNNGLRARLEDVPEARADELTASLRNAPALFLSGHQLPYGRYSEQRPGVAQYEVSPAVNVDYSGKRRSHMRQANLARRQVEARYQNAVREEIGRLYDAFVDVLEAHEALGAAQANLEWLTGLAGISRRLIANGQGTETDALAVSVQRFRATTTVEDSRGQLLQARRSLGALLAIPWQTSDSLEVCGTLRDPYPPPPGARELLRIALVSRPDLAAERLGVAHNSAGVQVARAEVFDDAIAFYSPFQADDNTPEGKRVSTAWGGGAGTTLPLLDRNQGTIAHARIDVTQTQMERDGLTRRVANEVQRARTEYEASRKAARELEMESIPLLRRLRDEARQRYAAGAGQVQSVLDAQKEHDEEVRRLIETLARHRRAMLKLNTVVGERILP